MPELNFQVEDAEAVPLAAAPMLALKLRITSSPADEPIHSIVLRCQIQIEALRRRYDAKEQERLFDLFGPPQEWTRTLRNVPWTEANVTIPSFVESTLIDLPLACTYDFNVAATKYIDSLEEGELPLCLLFSGTVFYATNHRPLQVAPISWDKEARYRLSVRVWREMMDHYYPDCVWFSLPRNLVDRLDAYRRRRAAPTWERALEALLSEVEKEKM